MAKAFISLLKEEEYSKVTVTKITEKANVNRGTFYKHYTYKEDILKEVQSGVLNRLTEIIETNYVHIPIDQISDDQLDTTLFEFVYEYREFFHLAINTSIFPNFQKEFCTKIEAILMGQYFSLLDLPEKTKPVLCRYIAYGFFGILVSWDADDYSGSVEEAAETTHRVLLHDFTELQKRSLALQNSHSAASSD
ncbi:MAG: TetR/AcrR family transcriptional regulator [Pisciglobus halotolerans]|nr:TetR/AcrR family transcriptional regulator [Pisciglobus halotolerans]